MAITLNNTAMSETANSYCDIDFADDYFLNHVVTANNDLWSVLDDDKKAQLLVQACYHIEQLKFTIPTNIFPFDAQLQYNNLTHTFFYSEPATPGVAVKYTSLQSLQFPRNIDMRSSGVFIPERILIAQCEQAIYLATFDSSVLSSTMQGVRSDILQAAGITISQRLEPGGTTVSPLVMSYVNPYILRRTGMRFQRA